MMVRQNWNYYLFFDRKIIFSTLVIISSDPRWFDYFFENSHKTWAVDVSETPAVLRWHLPKNTLHLSIDSCTMQQTGKPHIAHTITRSSREKSVKENIFHACENPSNGEKTQQASSTHWINWHKI